MKKSIFSILLVLGILLRGHSFAEGNSCCEWPSLTSDAYLQFRAGYFVFSDNKMRKVYGNGGYDLQLAASAPLYNWVDLYASVGFTHASGKATGTGRKARFQSVPLSLGLKPTFCIFDNLKGYFTVGPRYFFVKTNNHSPYVQRHEDRNGCGVFANVGLQYIPCDRFIIDTFWEYSYRKLHFHTSKHNVYTRSVQVGGYTFGLGLGYNF